MKIKVYLDKADAIKAGSDTHGAMEIDIDYSQLTEVERKLLGAMVGFREESVRVPLPDMNGVKEAIARKQKENAEIIARNEQEDQRRKEQHEKDVALALSTPDDQLIRMGSNEWTTTYILDQVRNDERVTAIYARVRALVISRNEALRTQRETDKAKKAADEEAAKAAWEADRNTWISLHGSDRLKKANAAEYSHNGAYATERAALELGAGWIVDTTNDYEWKTRSYPSEAALDLESQLNQTRIVAGYDKAEIVWVTSDGKDRDEDDDFEPYEAVVVREYLGRYDVVKSM